jgi:hypothetical protein
VIEQLCAALADGMPQKGACVAAGISESTLLEWKAARPEIADQMTEARETARLAALRSIKTAGDRDWRAHRAWLEMTFPNDYRGKVEVHAHAQASATTCILTPEKLQELQERKQKALREAALAAQAKSSEAGSA